MLLSKKTEEALVRLLQNQSYLELLILEPLSTQTREALRGFLRFYRKNARAQQAIEAVEATSSEQHPPAHAVKSSQQRPSI